MANLSVSSVERGLAILELLIENSEGLQISAISRHLSLPLSATHRLLQALINAHYVKQGVLSDRYVLTLKLGAIGLRQLAGMNITEAAQPILDDLARKTGELVRLAVVEDSEMTWVAKAQEATSSIRCDPISGRHVPLHTTGMGKAWLASMPEKEAIAMVVARGFDSELLGPNAVRTVAQLRREIRKTREMGFALNEQESELGLSAIAMLVKDRTRSNLVVGSVSIGGPTFRLDRERLNSFAEPLHEAIPSLNKSGQYVRMPIPDHPDPKLFILISKPPRKTMQSMQRSMREILTGAPVMPVLTIHDASVAGDLARALVDGGILVFEVLMRTPAAPDAIRAMVKAAPEAHVGAGTLLRSEDVARAQDAGAAFGVSPGLTETLGQAVRAAGLPFLPGVSSASEIMAAMELGFSELKFFPAHGSAGITWLQSMSGVFPSLTFCPTGGIKASDIPAYLALPNCSTVGCSWVTPASLVQARDWTAITALARQASAMTGA